jgi:hypothetical protein
MTAKQYVETLAQELARAPGGRGLMLSPADAQLALSWHAAGVPLREVIAQLRRHARNRRRDTARGALGPAASLQSIAQSIRPRARDPRRLPADSRLSLELRAAARSPGLAARQEWEALAQGADELLAHDGGDGYWSAAVRALKLSLRELPRKAALAAGAALRTRMAPRPRSMPRRRYQRSLQLMLLSAASERLGLPPRAFLL